MKRRAAAWLAWGSFAFGLACLAAVLLLTVGASSATVDLGQKLLSDLFQGLGLIGFPLVGALIASRHPENPIGWLFCSVCLVSAGSLAETLALRIVEVDPGAPAVAGLAWASILIYRLGYYLLFTITLLLYPTGRLPSRRWRPLAWLTAAWLAVDVLAAALAPGPLADLYPLIIINPVGVEALAGATRAWYAAEAPALLALALAATASLLVRYRGASPDERQQIKWFAFAAALFFAAVSFWGTITALYPASSAMALVGEIVFDITAAALPIATGFAILRHRLYDIDLIIRRTLVYGLLTAALALLYFGSVVVLQVVFRSLTGEGSQLAVVASTLTIAAAFSPLRRRMQDFIDRRFYRRKYDAARTLAAFAATARDETDLDNLAGRLVNVVDETMQPAHASLWLRENSARTGAARQVK